MVTHAQASFPFATTAPPAEGARRTRDPVHVALRSCDARWSLHAPRSEAALRAAATATRGVDQFHVFHVSVRGDDVHLLVEAHSADALAAGVHAFAAGATRALNRLAGRIGPVFAEGYSARDLRSSAEFREALRLLIGPERPR